MCSIFIIGQSEAKSFGFQKQFPDPSYDKNEIPSPTPKGQKVMGDRPLEGIYGSYNAGLHRAKHALKTEINHLHRPGRGRGGGGGVRLGGKVGLGED